jgi:poly-gamma-glutamate capsule biosynthesis protein CapA/YwtB (metallophosphatase superfamily)
MNEIKASLKQMDDYLNQIESGIIHIDKNSGGPSIDIIVAGDFCPDRRVEKMTLADRYYELYNDTLPALQNKDLSIVNLECPLTSHRNPIFKQGPNLSADPRTVKAITHGQFNVVTLANNHVLDQGGEGLLDTILHCENAGIKTVGAGKNIEEASRSLILQVKDTTVAILNFADIESSIATDKTAGAFPLDPIRNFYQIQEAKQRSDVVIVIVHGGIEGTRLPNPGFVETLRFFADLGASAVVAHHSHSAGAFEIHNGVPIFYSLGNFLFDRDYSYPYWFESYFIRLSLNQRKIHTIELVPYHQFKNGSGLTLMGEQDRQIFLKEIAAISRVIKNPYLYHEKWNALLSEKRLRYLTISGSLNKFERKMLKHNLWASFFMKKGQMVRMLNTIQCQSHREIMIDILKNEIPIISAQNT